MVSNSRSNLQGVRVVSFESRRAREMAELIRRYGGEPIAAPSLREVPLAENAAPIELFDKLERGQIDLLVLLTGVGTRTMIETIALQHSKERIAQVLGSVPIMARGPKPVAALKEIGLHPTFTAPEPNTWREVLLAFDAKLDLEGKRVAIQEYGVANYELLAALEARGAEIFRVPVYRWALPEDLGPLRAAIEEIKHGRVDVVIFTSATQVEHVFTVAREEQVETALRTALARLLVVSIGPVCSDALARVGLKTDLEPSHPKMGQLVAELAAAGRDLLEQKRNAASSST